MTPYELNKRAEEAVREKAEVKYIKLRASLIDEARRIKLSLEYKEKELDDLNFEEFYKRFKFKEDDAYINQACLTVNNVSTAC